jgi:[glutamine synthetase] adenylyltransferase / [glutamine synthetase]-adenylyl-L-tyrosine phosphorylase
LPSFQAFVPKTRAFLFFVRAEARIISAMSKLTPAEKRAFLEHCSDLPHALVQRHLLRLDNDYYEEFDAQVIRDHVRILSTLDASHRFHIQFESFGLHYCGLTLLGVDCKGFLAGLTGLLAGLGYEIRSARVFTCTATPGDGTAASHLIDFLLIEGRTNPSQDPISQEILRQGIATLFMRLHSGDTEGLRTDLIGRLMQSRQDLPETHQALPLDVHFESLPFATKLTVQGKDRKALLFCLSLGLSLQNITILKMTTTGEGDDIGDQFLVVNGKNQPLVAPEETEPLRVAMLLMERYLWALSAASDITSALKGLNRIITNWLPDSRLLAESWSSDPTFFPALARVLSAGPHLWDEVMAMGPEAFKRLLDERKSTSPARQRDSYASHLQEWWRQRDPEVGFRDLPEWRHREVLKIEIDFLLDPESRVEPMSEALTHLAEACLSQCVAFLATQLYGRYGFAGPFALMALGKFGGREMVTGSDLEVLVLYEKTGETTGGQESIRHGEWYSTLCKHLQQGWGAGQGTTLALDWRLRPHGESGPLAAHAQVWREYLAPNGGAADFERQAMIRMRPITGDAAFISQILAWRNEAVFRQTPVPIDHTLELRAQQIELKTKAKQFHSKYSPGAMVDIEYGVQFLQLRHGWQHPQLGQASTGQALEVLLEVGILTLGEFEHLYTAYLFYRRLQAHLRLYRGLARDLETPPVTSLEYRQLAIQLGFIQTPQAKPEQQLDWTIRRYREAVSGFFEYKFRQGRKPEMLYASLAQNLMDPVCPLEEAAPALRRLGMSDLPKARQLFLDLFACVIEKRILAAVLLVAEEHFFKNPDPEYALQQLVRYLQATPFPDMTVRQIMHHPPLLHAMLAVFGQSHHLSDIVIREPSWMKDVMRPGVLTEPKDEATLVQEAREWALQKPGLQGVSEGLCAYRDKEYLRIALRDVYLHNHLQRNTRDISLLSNALITVAAEHAFKGWNQSFAGIPWTVIAMGKLGGQELNYSSDIDLIFVREESPEADAEAVEKCFDGAARNLIDILSSNSSMGRIFRVDMNLRPWGKQGYLTGRARQYLRYYEEEAQGWELQAWLKARSVAGLGDWGSEFIRRIQAMATNPKRTQDIAASMQHVRHRSLETLQKKHMLAGEVKLGPGGIRTVEFFVQSLQVRHGHALPEIIDGNTLAAMGRLHRFKIITSNQYHTLASAYVFLRRVEHRMQLLKLQQEHGMPSDPREMEKLARRMGFDARFGQTARKPFLDQYRKHMLTLLAISGELFQH